MLKTSQYSPPSYAAIATPATPAAPKDAATPEYLDVRDDRINLYTGFHGNRGRQAVFYYAMRAVTPGRFRYAPIQAGAMYNGEYASASGGGTVTISR